MIKYISEMNGYNRICTECGAIVPHLFTIQHKIGEWTSYRGEDIHTEWHNKLEGKNED